MPGAETYKPAYRFGSFELDNFSGDLRKRGVRIKLQDQPRRILILLLEHSGEVVTREQIQKSLWPGDTFVEFDNAINSAVRKLRDVLGDTAENPRFIETVTRRGYRFLAPVSTTQVNTPEPELVPPPMVSAARPRDWRFVGPAIVVVILALIGTAKLVRIGGKEDIAKLRVAPLTANVGVEVHPSFSPDGTRIAYAWNGINGPSFAIYVKVIGAGDPVRITRDTARDFSPAWSPDGRWIAAVRDFGSESAIILIPASGGEARELARVAKAPPTTNLCASTDWPHVCGVPYWGPLLAWSQNGKYLFTSGYSKPDSARAIIRISVETRERQTITSPPFGIEGDFGPAVSPNGRELAFVRLNGIKTGDIYVIPLSGAILAGGEARRITTDGADVESPAWTPDGRELIFSSDRAGRHEIWRAEAYGHGELHRVAGMGENASDLAISRGGQRLVYSSGSYFGSLWKIPLVAGKGGVLVRVTATTARDKFSHFSPDGKRIVFQSGRSGVDEIWICGADGTNAIQLTSFGKGMSGSPRWSPDGKTIAFDSNVAGGWNIYSIPSDGGRPVRVTKGQPGGAIPAWSRDGRWIYFTSMRSGRLEIWKIRPDGGSETQVTTGGAVAAAESADGKYLYFTRGTEGSGELWKMPVGGGTAAKVLDSVRGRLYTVTPKGIYFAAGAPALELRYLSFSSGSIQRVARLGTFPHADVSSDERWALYPQPESTGRNLMLAENFR